MHKVLKDIIGSSRGGFNRVIVRIHHSVLLQIDSIRASMNMSLSKRPTDFDDPNMHPLGRAIFSRLFYKVSDRCFDHLLATYEIMLTGKFPEQCTDHWVRNCLGLPCVHQIAHAIISNTPLIEDDIHPFWRDLHWDDTPETEDDPNLKVRMNIIELRLHEMFTKLELGTLKKSTAYQLGELYQDLEHPELTTLKEPTNVRRKGRPKGAKNKDKEEVDSENDKEDDIKQEDMEQYEMEEAKQKSKGKKSTGARRPGRPKKEEDDSENDKEESREKSYFEHKQEELKKYEKEEAKQKSKGKKKANNTGAKRPGRPREQTTTSLPVVIEAEELHSQPMPDLSQPEGSNYTDFDQCPEELGVPLIHRGVDFGIDNLDDFWLPYITDVRQVRSDGHCGYRSMALLLGRKEQEYGNIRRELVTELLQNRELYEPIRRRLRPGTWEDLILQVNHCRSPCSELYWLHFPLMGLVFATLYQVGLVLLCWDAPTFCLPLRCRTENADPPRQIFGMAHVGNRDHFIPVK